MTTENGGVLPNDDFFMLESFGRRFKVVHGGEVLSGNSWHFRNHVRRIVALRWLLMSTNRRLRVIDAIKDYQGRARHAPIISRQHARMYSYMGEDVRRPTARVSSMLFEAYHEQCKILHHEVKMESKRVRRAAPVPI